MSYAYADWPGVTQASISTEDSDGTAVDAECVMIPVLIPVDQVEELLANYDPSSHTSPLVAYSRPMARVILDALKRYHEGS